MNQQLLSRAAVFHASGQPLSIEQIAVPELQRNEVLVRITYATICGSDLHSFSGRRSTPLPTILGHEMIGTIAALPPSGARDFQGNALSMGDRITWSMVLSCGDCYYCRHDLRPKCEHLLKFGHEKISSKLPLFGGLAEYCHLPAQTAIFKVPENLEDRIASPANCATATVAAVFRYAGNCKDKNIVIQGAGMLGLTACAVSTERDGAKNVICLEPHLQRRLLAPSFGANEVIDSSLSEKEVRDSILSLTEGRGADLALDFCGLPEALERGFDLLRFGGLYVIAGATFPSREVHWSGMNLVRRMLQIIGVYNYQPEDLATALQFLDREQHNFPFADLVARTFSLDEANQAIDFAERMQPPRVAVIP